MLRDKPDLALFAETGGKNATIVTAMADRDLAIKCVVHSAFSHAGQKCSATSLLLLEGEVYDDPEFREALCDATGSLVVGSAWELPTRMGPLIRPPSGDLGNALTLLGPGEWWAVRPRRLEDNPNLWSPGIKYGVQPGSDTHLTEFFGPLLGVMRFTTLAEAIALVNQTGYGLTSGLQSLDDREQEQWKAGIQAGNLYINRTTVGAIVLRQPFGGMGKSAFGPGLKAGGPNYVAEFMEFTDADEEIPGEPPSDPLLAEVCARLIRSRRGDPAFSAVELQRLLAAIRSYALRHREEFGRSHDDLKLVGQDNLRRYLPVERLRIRAHPDDTSFELLARVCAARTAGCGITLSCPPGLVTPALRLLEELTAGWAGAIALVEESDEQLASLIREHQTDRLRYAAPDRVVEVIWRAAAETGLCIVSRRPRSEGRLELLWYMQEQSISFDYHRYGNLGMRADEPRARVL
jgi:RHH-type proline utilization regulon transcriptional repressor/proline dehydrogenase/delta 1-pyrroline-5-carboxylate dehydrogenase